MADFAHAQYVFSQIVKRTARDTSRLPSCVCAYNSDAFIKAFPVLM